MARPAAAGEKVSALTLRLDDHEADELEAQLYRTRRDTRIRGLRKSHLLRAWLEMLYADRDAQLRLAAYVVSRATDDDGAGDDDSDDDS